MRRKSYSPATIFTLVAGAGTLAFGAYTIHSKASQDQAERTERETVTAQVGSILLNQVRAECKIINLKDRSKIEPKDPNGPVITYQCTHAGNNFNVKVYEGKKHQDGVKFFIYPEDGKLAAQKFAGWPGGARQVHFKLSYDFD